MVADKDLDTAITNLPHPTVEKIAEKFSENRTTVERQMHALGFVTKLDQWIRNQLATRQSEERISTCVSLLSCNNEKPFLTKLQWMMRSGYSTVM